MESEFVPGVSDLQLIGRGATASVFLGHRVSTGETVVAKVLNVRLTSPDDIARFERELDAVIALSGERSIARVHDRGVNDSGHPWFLTDYLPDHLQSALDRSGRLPWNEAIIVGTQVADALAAAHRGGVLHGDLKPSDIRFDALGVAQLADLGLARYAGTGGSTQQSAAARMAHCPPEVAAGRRVDERTDLYALASVLYEAVTGSPPFGRLVDLGAPALMDRILTVPAASLAPFSVPPALDALLLGALSKDPSRRPASARVFADALAAGAAAQGATRVVPARTAPTNSRQQAMATAATAPDDSGYSTSPLGIDDIPFDELATPPDGYPILEEFPVLDAVEAAPLLEAAGRRERRRRREKRVLAAAVGVALAGAVVAGVWWLIARDGSDPRSSVVTSTSALNTVAPMDTLVPGTDALRPVGAITYSFSVTFDTAQGEATLSGMASPTGEARLKNAMISIGRVDNQLDIQDGVEPDGGASIGDAVTLLAAMRKDLTAGTLRFDGQTFRLSGYFVSGQAEANLREVISLLRTPVSRPDLQPDPGVTTDPGSSAPVSTTPTVILVQAQPTTFVVPGDGRFHILPLTLVPDGGSTQLCLFNRTVTGGDAAYLTMNYSSCTLARVVSFSSSVRGTYVVTDTFVDERGATGPTATVTFTVVVT